MTQDFQNINDNFMASMTRFLWHNLHEVFCINHAHKIFITPVTHDSSLVSITAVLKCLVLNKALHYSLPPEGRFCLNQSHLGHHRPEKEQSLGLDPPSC